MITHANHPTVRQFHSPLRQSDQNLLLAYASKSKISGLAKERNQRPDPGILACAKRIEESARPLTDLRDTRRSPSMHKAADEVGYAS
ncbi:hypothetical protein GCM10010990_15790 [Croceicoccus mobilis]|uniref:Uncharacterized protein n=1 Tax=Croceicoccus mobilis TaxID=1703339 RepID=A0A916YYI7_9SPHN|nr:hypothetical protein GCM10010990_15790 [Croceicoccus mobilis]